MKTATIFILILSFLQIPTSLNGQSYSEAKPIMTNKLLKDFMHAHLMYPDKARQSKTEGNVIIEFQIDKNGLITQRSIVEQVSPEINGAALELFDLILWIPATDYGIPIASTGEFKIQYNLKKYNKYVKSRGYDLIDFKDLKADTSNIIYKLSQLTKTPKPLMNEKYSDLGEFIFNEMEYPDEAKKLAIKGNVKLSFIIETNGLPSNIYVVETLGGGCCEESIRILQLLKWIPGIKDNLYVRTSYELNIHFNPADEHRSKHIPNQSNSGI